MKHALDEGGEEVVQLGVFAEVSLVFTDDSTLRAVEDDEEQDDEDDEVRTTCEDGYFPSSPACTS